MTTATSLSQKYFIFPILDTAASICSVGPAATAKNFAAQGIKAVANQACAATSQAFRFARSGGAMNVLGRRIALIGNGPVNHAYFPLEKIDRALTEFRQRQPLDAHSPAIPTLPASLPTPAAVAAPTLPVARAALTPAIPPSNPPTVINQMAETDRQLGDLSQNLIYFIPLYTMAYIGDIQESDLNQTIISMVKEASATKKPVKEIFYKQYGNRFTKWQRLKIWLFNLIGSSFLFSKTINVYMEHILKEMRTRLSEARWTEKGENTERMIDDLIHFLDLYKNATLEYAEAKKPTGGLNTYREEAAESMFQKSIQEISNEFSKTLVEHLSPTVKYFSGTHFFARHANSFLNKIVRLLLNRYLPTGIHSVILETNAATKPSQLPFVKALTDTATEQLQKLLESLDQGPSLPEPPPVAGTKRLKDAVENLLYVVQFSKSTTQEAILAKKKEIDEKKKNPGIDAEIQQGIQDSILKGVQILLRHLAEPTNSEEMFTNFCKLANISFSTGEVVTVGDLQKSKDKLDLTARNIGKRLAKEAIEERFQASRPEQLEKSAEEAFLLHHTNAKTLAEHLAAISQVIENKISTTRDILTELDSMAQLLQAFSTKEQIAADLKTLQEVDREGIIRSFAPVYASIEKLTHQMLRLQELQLLYKSHVQIASSCKTLEDALMLLGQEGPSEMGLQRIAAFDAIIQNIAKYLPPDAPEIQEMRKLCNQLKTSFAQVHETTQKHAAFVVLNTQIEDLKKPELKKAAFGKILEMLDLLPAAHKTFLLPLIRNLNHLSPTDAPFAEVWKTFNRERDRLLAEYEAAKALALQNMVSPALFQAFVRERKEGYEDYRLDNLRDMAAEHKNALEQIKALKTLIAQTKKETLPQISPQHLGMIAGAGLGALSWFYPPVGLSLAAGAYTAAGQIGPLLRGGSDRTYACGKIGLAALSGVGSAFLAGQSGLAAFLPAAMSYAPLQIASAAAIGGAAGSKIVDTAIGGGQDLVFEKITEFFDIAYEFLLSGEITKPAAKILMHEVVASFR